MVAGLCTILDFMLYNTLISNFIDGFNGFTDKEINLIESGAYLQNVDAGAILHEDGSACSKVYFVVKGRIRLYRILPDGKEITLYRVRENEMCLFSMSCILNNSPLDAIAYVEKTAELLVFPENVIMTLVDQNKEFRNFLFRRLLKSLSEVMYLVEELTFHSMNQRLARYLLLQVQENKKQHMKVNITHEQIALELGTAREVISRLLKEFEMESIVSLSRGMILVKNESMLKNLADV